MNDRPMATIQKVVKTYPIEGCDNIEQIEILGWQLIAKKGEFKEGDLAVYFEIGSKLYPNPDWDTFLAKVDYKIKTMKMRKTISQGLALPISFFKSFPKWETVKIEENFDVTQIIGVGRYDSEPEDEKTENPNKKSKNKFVRFFMKFAWFRKLYFLIKGQEEKGDFPNFIGGHTDEINISSCPNILKKLENEILYVSEKIEGSSFSAFIKKNNNGLINKIFNNIDFGVCSRNVWKKYNDNSNWWQYVVENDVENKLKKAQKELGFDIAIQGELAGKSKNGGAIQGNIYKFDNLRLFIFNVYNITLKKEFSYDEMRCFCENYGFETVPILDTNFNIKGKTVKDIISYSTNKSVFGNNILREGVVIRSKNNPKSNSFKARSPEYLLEHGF